MPVNVILEGLNSGGLYGGVSKFTESGVEYQKLSTNGGDVLEQGDIGIDYQFSDGTFMVQGIFLDVDGLADNDINNWEINWGV